MAKQNKWFKIFYGLFLCTVESW